jgi:hypothetical protein
MKVVSSHSNLIQEVQYEDIFSPQTLDDLKSKSREALNTIKQSGVTQGDLMRILPQVAAIEKERRQELEDLAADILKQLYPVINDLNIELDLAIEDQVKLTPQDKKEKKEQDKKEKKEDEISSNATTVPEEDQDDFEEQKRRVINSITQGASIRGTFGFLMFREAVDRFGPELYDQYNKLMKATFAQFDDENIIAMMLQMLAAVQGQAQGGGEVKAEWDSENDKFKITARALNFPMLLHEGVKGLYEIVSLQGFTRDEVRNKSTVAAVDKVEFEPEDMRYGKFIFDALRDLYLDNYSGDDDRVREYLFAEIYKLEAKEFLDFIERLLNDALTPNQQRWVKRQIDAIVDDLKADDVRDLE